MQQSPPQARHDTEQRAQRDGCDCPPWVIRCAHYGDSGVVQSRYSLFRETWKRGTCTCLISENAEYSIAFLKGEGWVPCVCGATDVPMIAYNGQEPGQHYDSLSEANAIFDAAVERLLREAE